MADILLVLHDGASFSRGLLREGEGRWRVGSGGGRKGEKLVGTRTENTFVLVEVQRESWCFQTTVDQF